MTITNLKKWQLDSNYIGEDYSNFYVVLSKHRDSNLIEDSNFECVRRDIEFYYPDSTEVIHLSHWAVGWVELLLIHESNTEALEEADQIAYKLESIYPIYDEDHYSTLVYESAEEIWLNAPDWEREEICQAIGVTYDGTEDIPEGGIDYIIESWEL